jgi:hypothetical protein
MEVKLKNQELWNRLRDFSVDEPSSSFTLTQRLARENGWSIEYSKRVIDEYKKFLYLAMTTKDSVTPSDEVDQAWHLHMLYTESYWDELCGKVLGREIGHGPTKGGNSEKVKYNDQYNKTLAMYKDAFGFDAPSDIWPDAQKRFSNVNYQRVNMAENFVLSKSKVKEYMALYVIAPILLLTSILLMSAGSKSNEDISFERGLWIIVLIIVGIFIIRGIWRYVNRNNRGGGSSGSSSGSGDGCSIIGSFFGCGSDGCSSSGCGSSGCGSSGCSGCGGCGD